MFQDATKDELDEVMEQAWTAFNEYRGMPLHRRAAFMRAIAKGLDSTGDGLIQVAMRETSLPEARLKGERARTVFQLNSYADACEQGSWLDARIDTAIPEKTPPKPDIRKMLIPLGPVVVFGASNFPFAYSTAGGDTACAFAAGCPVIVKCHPAHEETSTLVAAVIHQAITDCNMPAGLFSHVHGREFEVGRTLVQHPLTRAVGFTGSTSGGQQLFEWGNQRKTPIPVFAEMGSINPVFLLPKKMQESAADLASLCAGSVTLGVGQFCTNPGLIIGVEGEPLQRFIDKLAEEIRGIRPARMLHPGIAKAFGEKSKTALQQPGVSTVAEAGVEERESEGRPVVASVSGDAFLNNPVLHQEVFGPYSLVVRCADMDQMRAIARQVEGQLTTSLMATAEDLLTHKELLHQVQNICGRLILNAVPTGVEVCLSMHHGGPYPATTDSRFTSVGADGIRRFARPLAFQNWSDDLLPDELKNGNPLNIWRTVNNIPTTSKISN